MGRSEAKDTDPLSSLPNTRAEVDYSTTTMDEEELPHSPTKGFLPNSFFEKVDEFLQEDYLFLDADADDTDDDTTSDTDQEEGSSERSGTFSIPRNGPKPTIRRNDATTAGLPALNTYSPSQTSTASFKKADAPAAPQRLPHKSVLKKSSSYGSQLEDLDDNDNPPDDVIPINTQKSAWKALPAPKLEPVTMRKVGSSPSLLESHDNNNNNKARPLKRNVSFSDIHIRDYNMTLGDHPSCSRGTPVSLDWDYAEPNPPMRLDQYERHRARRSRQEFHLDASQREDIVRQAGFSRGEIQRSQRGVARVRRQRATTQSRLSLMPLEDWMEKATRKLRRLHKRSNHNNNEQGNTSRLSDNSPKQKATGWKNILRRTKSANDLAHDNDSTASLSKEF